MNSCQKGYLLHQLHKAIAAIETIPTNGEPLNNINKMEIGLVFERLIGCRNELTRHYGVNGIKLGLEDPEAEKPLKKRYEFHSVEHRVNYIRKILINKGLTTPEDNEFGKVAMGAWASGVEWDEIEFLAKNVENMDIFYNSLDNLTQNKFLKKLKDL